MIIRSDNINLKQIAESGQCFRMNELERNKYSLTAFDRYIILTQPDDYTVELDCTEEEFNKIWRSYFDLDYDYKRIIDRMLSGSDTFLKNAAEFGRGIRILRQEPFEALISFIISQNKNIPAIKACIERLCEHYGNRMVHKSTGTIYYTFPKPGVLAEAEKEELKGLKLGYRDEYVLRAARAVADGTLKLDELAGCTHQEAVNTLKKLYGVGDKVANCVSLYGLHHIEAFPVDIWIKKVIDEIYNGAFNYSLYEEYAGIVQQYMFYYKRVQDLKKADI